MNSDWRKARVKPDMALAQAMQTLGDCRQHVLLVVDGDERLLGLATDGDIRRAILQMASLSSPIGDIMNRSPMTVGPDTDRQHCLHLMRQRQILHLPVTDSANRLVGLIKAEDLVLPEIEERANWTVVMAGGLGKRLRPLTETLPKPMLPVGGRPILETILQGLAGHGLRKFYLSVNYKADIIKSHFGDGSALGYQIRYLEEDKALGTAGALGLLPEAPEQPFLVMNGDLLTKADFGAILDQHQTNGWAASVCTRPFEVQVPYGVVQQQGKLVSDIVEKPLQRFQVNAGIYAVSSWVPGQMITPGEAVDMTELLRRLWEGGHPVGCQQMHQYWMDIGRMEDFSQAESEFRSLFQ